MSVHRVCRGSMLVPALLAYACSDPTRSTEVDEVARERTTDALSARSSVSTEPHFAYATNAADGTLSIYAVDASTGQLRDRGYALTGTAPRSVAVDPAERFVFVANETSDDVLRTR